jgi:hypothetical protein
MGSARGLTPPSVAQPRGNNHVGRSWSPRYWQIQEPALAAWVAVKLSTQASPGHRLENLYRFEISGEPAFAAAVMFDIAIAAALSDAGQAQVKLFDILVLPERLGVAV